MSADPHVTLLKKLAAERCGQMGFDPTCANCLGNLHFADKMFTLGLAAGVEQERERCCSVVERVGWLTGEDARAIMAAIRAAASEAPPHP